MVAFYDSSQPPLKFLVIKYSALKNHPILAVSTHEKVICINKDIFSQRDVVQNTEILTIVRICVELLEVLLLGKGNRK